jgi:hypothetical protein
MTSESETQKIGLMFVEAQLLRRSALAYADLVSVLQTTLINPNYPQGKALVILEKHPIQLPLLATTGGHDGNVQEEAIRQADQIPYAGGHYFGEVSQQYLRVSGRVLCLNLQ